ncbi:cobalamin biosynthesis protein [Nocardia yamanashiensis]|uniref:cobalamin biosynthesis protein n=1 Tax=Nocardia yamanashiensis TaxID=209247 RepID=UPI000A02BA71|nr:cobalamin biosynthesis protein [Nocardia yamanashiensis]
MNRDPELDSDGATREWELSRGAPAVTLPPGEYAVGVGLRPGVAADSVLAAILEVLGDSKVRVLATVDRRAGEPGLTAAAARLAVSIVAFTPAELAGVVVPNPSMRTTAAVGTASVAEAAALLAAEGGSLVVPKRVVGGMTIAAAIFTKTQGP